MHIGIANFSTSVGRGTNGVTLTSKPRVVAQGSFHSVTANTIPLLNLPKLTDRKAYAWNADPFNPVKLSTIVPGFDVRVERENFQFRAGGGVVPPRELTKSFLWRSTESARALLLQLGGARIHPQPTQAILRGFTDWVLSSETCVEAAQARAQEVRKGLRSGLSDDSADPPALKLFQGQLLKMLDGLHGTWERTNKPEDRRQSEKVRQAVVALVGGEYDALPLAAHSPSRRH